MKPIAETNQARYNYDRIFTKQGPPQGMTEEQFQLVSERLRGVCNRNPDGQVIWATTFSFTGVAGMEQLLLTLILYIGIRVTAERLSTWSMNGWHMLQKVRQVETLQRAPERGRLHQGETGISGISKEIQRLVNEEMGLGFTKGVQVTVIREAGPFDQGRLSIAPGQQLRQMTMEPDLYQIDLFCRINVQAEMSFQEFVEFIAPCAGGPVARMLSAARH